MKKYAFLVIDTETTGLGDDDELLEFAACAPDGSIAWRSLFKPVRHASWPEAEKINRISPSDVEFAMTADQQKEGISELLSTACLVAGYNVKFDLRFLQRSGIELPPDTPCADIMDAAVDFFGKRVSLSDACAKLGIAFSGNGPHSAGSDARAALQVLSATALAGLSSPLSRLFSGGLAGEATEGPGDLEAKLHGDRASAASFMRYAYAI